MLEEMGLTDLTYSRATTSDKSQMNTLAKNPNRADVCNDFLKTVICSFHSTLSDRLLLRRSFCCCTWTVRFVASAGILLDTGKIIGSWYGDSLLMKKTIQTCGVYNIKIDQCSVLLVTKAACE